MEFGIVGFGRMGGNMARRLARKGSRLRFSIVVMM